MEVHLRPISHWTRYLIRVWREDADRATLMRSTTHVASGDGHAAMEAHRVVDLMPPGDYIMTWYPLEEGVESPPYLLMK